MGLAELYLQNMPWSAWIADKDKKIIFINKAFERKYNLNLEDVKGKNYEEIFPDEVIRVYNKKTKESLKKLQIDVYDKTTREIKEECYAFPITDEEGQTNAIGGIIVNVEDEKRREMELQNQKSILRTIIDALPEAIFYKDKDSRFIGCNKNFSDYYKQFGVDDVIGKSDLEIYPDKEVAENFIKIDKEIMKSKQAKYIEGMTLDSSGDRVIEESFKAPVINEDGQVWGVVGLARNITNQKNLEDRLRYLSYNDALTGIYNRTYFEEKIRELNNEQHLPLGIIMGDVNGLKLVNDSLGHLEGDKLLKSIAGVLNKACGDKGYVFRWGGDEFMILLPNCNEYSCERMVEKIRSECKKDDYSYIELSIALGEVVKHSLEEDIDKCIKEVEERVYRQKLLEHNSVRSSMMNSLKKSLEAKNMETEEHTERVESYALEIGKRYGFKSSQMDELMIIARLHDIGKIAIEEDILLKPGPLTTNEFEVMKTHAEKGFRIINASSEIINVAKCVLTHHEKWDGSGYPLGIAGEEIPLMARIIAIADAYDVMTHDRVYRKAMNKEEAIKELKRCAGTQFDPVLVELFLKCLDNNEEKNN
ncbi:MULTISPECIES: sensor domain-containing diguanylate cyclase/phosphohydrolase [unclassified Clostridium]|uniref:sensor domain-containing diguanylate cyclase/phosphohydrolase n=1 Tax=unclassified Clostridium TaxID=2614128 RepID=UPI00321809E6